MRQAAHPPIRHKQLGRRMAAGLVVLALSASLSACDNLSSALGFGKNPPDEFAVVRSAPLTLPPDFTLRPPRPGEPRPNEATVRDQAESVLLQEAGVSPAENAAATSGEAALIERAGATDVDPNIRQIVDREFAGFASEDESFVESLMFWRDTQPPGEVVDAEAEAERLRESIEAGEPVTAGETPTIKRREKALLEDLF